ncbi:hypothetical protein OROHE_012950 [Orobanche hederae]
MFPSESLQPNPTAHTNPRRLSVPDFIGQRYEKDATRYAL